MKLSGKLYTCNTCGKKKPIQEYYLRSNGKIADHRCKKCMSDYKKRYRENNYNDVRKNEISWRENNPEKVKETDKRYRTTHKEICNQRNRDHYNKNIEEQRARSAKKRSDRLKRTPPWLSKEDLAKIKSIYKMSHALSKKTGVTHHVDHIIPLQGKNVSGLHVPWNLQVIPEFENLSKGNSFNEDMI